MPSVPLPHAPADLGDALSELAAEVKPRLRGWLHAGILPLAVAGGIVLIGLSPTLTTRLAAGVFTLTALLLFGVSAIYHTGTWSPVARERLKRLDHVNIFLLIAGSYTPFAVLVLHPEDATVLLSVVWAGAVLGVVFRVLWLGAPRWLYVPVYLALGWAAVFWAPEFTARASTAVLVLLVVCGGLYSLGAVVYGLRRPDPAPAWFGYHEVFHGCTIAAFSAGYAGILVATVALR